MKSKGTELEMPGQFHRQHKSISRSWSEGEEITDCLSQVNLNRRRDIGSQQS